MKITEKVLENKILMEVEGRVDTVTSPELQNAILLSLQKMPNLEIDFSKVAYISSAGLRSLLMGHKTASSKQGEMVLTHVPDVVMEVFATTGFNTIIKIK